MRSHGVPNFPDPSTGPTGGQAINLEAGIDLNARRARRPSTCQSSDGVRRLTSEPAGGLKQPDAMTSARDQQPTAPALAGTREEPAPDRRKAPWVIALVVVLVAAGVAVAITKPFGSGGAGSPGVAENADATGIYTVARQDLSSQTQVSATLGYAGSYSIAAPSGTSAQEVAQAQQAVDRRTSRPCPPTSRSNPTSRPPTTRRSRRPRATSPPTRPPSARTRPPRPRTAPGRGRPARPAAQATQKVSQDQTAADPGRSSS